MPNRILLVDDDKEFREEFKDCLGEYDVSEAANGEEALKILKRPNEIDLVVLDVSMPGMSGTEVLRQIKEIAPDLGIVILTGHSSEEIAIEALKGRADDYIEKPIDVDETKGIIGRLLEAKKEESRIDAGDLNSKIERAKRFAERNCFKKIGLEDAAKAVSLSPKYLSRVFKETTGMRFSDYRLNVKIRRAKAFLKETAYNVNQISQKLGYANTESFLRIFKKMTGCTPKSFRKKRPSKGRKAR